ncbi:hypothetical protein [Echinicola marina]|uniref:hypothetical protein n=1 Tax=Echinicola marina TaxID=2859768 RepID=UPI001CF6D440|nr:hypothetical protein [Echinicola marina]
MINIQKDELIIKLIHQDLKHNQLVQGLNNLDLDAGHRHHLGIMDLVKRLMEVPEHLENDFLDTYMSYMGRCIDYPISSLGEELRGGRRSVMITFRLGLIVVFSKVKCYNY